MKTAQENLDQLPYSCYGVLKSENTVISIYKGDSGYKPLRQLKPDDNYKTVEEIANALNSEKGITKAQRAAMEWGSQFGWAHGLSDVTRYDKDGNIKTSPEVITNLEKEVITNIINSEYMDAVDKTIIGWSVWSFSATNQKKQLAGALGSLVKKGFCFSEESDKDPVCGLTEKGYYWAKDAGLINA